MKVYIRPVNIIFGKMAVAAVEAGAALPFLGRHGAFQLAEVTLRKEGVVRQRDVVTAGDLNKYCAGLPASLMAPAEESMVHLMTARAPLNGGGKTIDLDRPVIQGIVNVTPHSFSDGGQFLDPEVAIAHGQGLKSAGVDILDIGGESTRPGARPVPVSTEMQRILPVIEGLRGCGAVLSVDTRHSEVMRASAAAGVDMLNDVSALTHDEKSLSVAAQTRLPVVLMHAQGTPQNMQDRPEYTDVLFDVFDYLQDRIRCCVEAGVEKSRIIVDPGIGFGKTASDNIELLKGVSLFHALGVPVLLGVSRKTIIGYLTGAPAPQDRVTGSVAVAQEAWAQGVQIVRVHDVRETKQALRIWSVLHGVEEAPN